jgi:hypothetical protein
MTSAGQGAGPGCHATRGGRAGRAARLGSLFKAQVAGLAIVVSSLVLAAPAHAVPGEPGQVPAAQTSALSALGQHNTLLRESGGRLPFERHDLAILMFGGVIVVLAAAGAPFLLRPLRGLPPALVTAATTSDPMLPGAAVGGAAHATA